MCTLAVRDSNDNLEQDKNIYDAQNVDGVEESHRKTN